MNSEDELLCALAAVIIQRKKPRKRRENTGYEFSRFTKKKETWRFYLRMCCSFRKSTSDSYSNVFFLISTKQTDSQVYQAFFRY